MFPTTLDFGLRQLLSSIAAILLIGPGLVLWAPAETDAQDLFRQRIAPILQQRCVSCHNDNDLDGGLSLQSAAAFSKGGESGELVVKGKPDESSLIDYISGEEPEMPKDQKPLTAKEVELFRKWVKDGAAWPADFKIAYRSGISRDWWSMKPLTKPKLEEPRANPIDYFVGKKHQELGLSFSAEAERKVLIRRLYYDLIGLPPSIAEVKQFVQSKDPLAYEKLVDRLLDSPRYGERWARHWLDVVQYGETHGYDKDKPRTNAWPYRDYVIRALNEDKPYSRFVREQLAGDSLYPFTRDGIVATGFIAAGPWDFIGHAEVPESKTDGQVARNLDRDNMVSSTMNTFCSLTVQCARCHNHKLDPVTMEEYYNLQAVFAAVDRADRDYDADPRIAKRRRTLVERKTAIEAKITALEGQVSDKKQDDLVKLEKQLAQLQSQVNSGFPQPKLPKSRRMGYHSQVASDQNTAKWVQLDLGQATSIDTVLLFGAVEYGFDDFGFPHRFVVEASLTADFQSSDILLDSRNRDYPRPGSLPVVIRPDSPVSARFVRVTATKLWNRRVKGSPQSKDWIFAMGEMSVVSNDRHVAVKSVTALDSIEASPGWGKANLVDHLFGGYDLETRLGRIESKSNGYHSQFADGPDVTKWVQLNWDQAQIFDEIRVYPAYPTDFKETPGFGFPLRFKIEVANDPGFDRSVVVYDQTAKDFPSPLLKPLVVRLPSNKKFQHVRLTSTRLWNRGDPGGKNHALALAELEVLSQGRNLAASATVTALDSINAGRWHTNNLVDGHTSRLPVVQRMNYLAAVGKNEKLSAQLDGLKNRRQAMFEQQVGPKLINELNQTQAELAQLNSDLAALPKPSKVYAGTVHRGSGAFRGRAGLGPREIYVLHRGEVTQKKQKAIPGTVDYIPESRPVFDLPEGHDESDRRIALANWIVRKDNPLTWRSVVNRVWHYHFGKGIVDTPNDFGRGGSLPSHAKLLDWLAVEFRDGGEFIEQQSIKSLHRLICTSRTYRQSSKSDRHDRFDQSNRYLWKMNRRRLSAEEIHDSVLQVAGILNEKMGGPSYRDFVVERPEHSPHYEYHLYDPNDPSTHRRAVYRFIVRSQPQPLMDTLNCADPSFSVPKRSETLTALQALGLLNNRFMVAMSQRYAENLAAETGETKAQVQVGFQRLTGRAATSEELELLVNYCERHGLENLCRVLFNLNEFIFVD